MGDSDSQRVAKNTQEIAFHLKTMNKILEAFNTNLVEAIRTFKTLVNLVEEEELTEKQTLIRNLTEEKERHEDSSTNVTFGGIPVRFSEEVLPNEIRFEPPPPAS